MDYKYTNDIIFFINYSNYFYIKFSLIIKTKRGQRMIIKTIDIGDGWKFQLKFRETDKVLVIRKYNNISNINDEIHIWDNKFYPELQELIDFILIIKDKV